MNCKAGHRVLKQLGRLVHQRVTMPCPRVRAWLSRTNRSNERWATPGAWRIWQRLSIVTIARRSTASSSCGVERTLCPIDAPVLRSDNELIFQSRQFREARQGYWLRQKFTRPTRRSRMASSSGSFIASSHSGRTTVVQP